MFLIQKYTQYKAAQAEQQKRKVTEKELAQLNHKIDKLLTKLDEHEPEIAVNQDEECVVCVNAKATMQTYPCGHRVVCRKCFVKTIQMAVAQRLLPLRCVICRAKILRLKHSTGLVQPLPASASQYTIGHHWYNVPQSASLYSVTSNASAASGASSGSSCSSSSSYKTCASTFSSASFRKSHSGYSKLGYKPLRTTSPSPSRSPQPRSTLAMAMAKKDNRVAPAEATVPLKGKLSLIQEFRREFSHGKDKTFPNNTVNKAQSKENKLKLHDGQGHGQSNAKDVTRTKNCKQLDSPSQNQSQNQSQPESSSSCGSSAGNGIGIGNSCSNNGSSINGSSKGKGTSRSNSSGSLAATSPDGAPSRSASQGPTTQKRLSLQSTSIPQTSKVSVSPMKTSSSFLSGGGINPTGLSSASISSASSGSLNPTPNRKTCFKSSPNPATPSSQSMKTSNPLKASTPPPKLPPPTTTLSGTTLSRLSLTRSGKGPASCLREEKGQSEMDGMERSKSKSKLNSKSEEQLLMTETSSSTSSNCVPAVSQ